MRHIRFLWTEQYANEFDLYCTQVEYLGLGKNKLKE